MGGANKFGFSTLLFLAVISAGRTSLADFSTSNVLKIRRSTLAGSTTPVLKPAPTPDRTPASRNWKIVVPPWQRVNGLNANAVGNPGDAGANANSNPNSDASSQNLNDLIQKTNDLLNAGKKGKKSPSAKIGSSGQNGGDEKVTPQEVGTAPPPNDVGDRGGEPPGGGGIGPGDGDSETEEVDRSYWIPYCFIVPPGMPLDQINAGVKGVVDSYGACDIAVEPYVFRVKYIPGSGPDMVNDLAKKVCPLNSIFGVSGAGVQTLVPSDTMSDEMCRSYDDKGKPTTNVGGCSELGNGNSSGGIPSQYTQGGGGNYGAAGQSGVPAASMVDQAAWGSPGVWCHETGHSIGMPGRGGDNLVNQGEGEAPDGGLGLEKIKRGGKTAMMCQEPEFHAAEGGGLGSCSFTGFGCASLRGGSNPNDGRHKWDKKRKIYYYDRPSDPPPWDLLRGQSFFDYIEPPSEPPIQTTKKPPADITKEELVYNESANKEGNRRKGEPRDADPGGGHKKQSGSGGAAERLVNSSRSRSADGVQGGLEDDEDLPLPTAKINNGSSGGAGLVYDENAKKGDDETYSGSTGGAGSLSSSGSSTSTTFGGGSGGNGSGSLTYDEGAAKNGAAGASGPGRSNRSPASNGGAAQGKSVTEMANESADGLDQDFFKKIIKGEDQRRKRVKGSTLRKNGGSRVR